jgi:uncharacterized protein (DUF885 family)
MRTIALVLALSSFGCATAPPPSSEPAIAAPIAAADAVRQELDRLFESYFEDQLRLNPMLATSIGDDRYNNVFPVTISEEHRARRREIAETYLQRLAAIDRAALDDQQRLSHSMLTRALKTDLEALRFPDHLVPLNQFNSVPSSFAQLGSGRSTQRFRSTRDYDDFLGRIDGFERWVDTAIANMRRGIELGIVQPRALMEKVIPQLEAHIVENPDESIFFRPLQDFPDAVSAADRDRLTTAYRTTIRGRIVPAYRKLRDFVRDEYLEKTRSTSGLTALPDGDAWYRHRVAASTTTELTPEQIHELGLAEVARIHNAMNHLRETVGFKGDLHAFFAHLESAPHFYFSSDEEMLRAYHDRKARISSTLPRLFSSMPKADFVIRPVEPFRERSAAGGSYTAATPDGSRPGVFSLNTYDLRSRPRYDVTSLSLHEGSPGHHFQISIQRGLSGIPKFRRFGGYTAYSEGWALYAETLGHELGLYTDHYQHFGQLSAELWRAIRLVLDTGIHHKGWTREQAIQYALDNSSVGHTRSVAEVERFMAIPGQALAYKIGQLEISRLRRESEEALGSRFDRRAFHEAVLGSGALPLDLLDAEIDRWVSRRKAE